MNTKKLSTYCPYCGQENVSMVQLKYANYDRQFVYCNRSRDLAGCGRTYAVFFELSVKPIVFRLDEVKS